jgi:magnesium-transporting ATPase (P-type)
MRLAQFKAIVSRRVSIEEMAGMNMLCTDKTGTLTKNELTLADLEPAAGIERAELIQAAVLASQFLPNRPPATPQSITRSRHSTPLIRWQSVPKQRSSMAVESSRLPKARHR